MKIPMILLTLVVSTTALVLALAQQPPWNAQAAAAYLDARQDWWQVWPNAKRDHDTTCVSCHTVLPYALARPALGRSLKEQKFPAAEAVMLANVVKRVRLWKEVEPFYSDQTSGLPKTSESRGMESVMNALILATRDEPSGVLSDDARQAFSNMWALQLQTGDLKGAWAWLTFKNEPWEAVDSGYFGASLAAIAIGTAPGDYASKPEIKKQMSLLREYLQQKADSERLFNRVMVLWASNKIPDLLTSGQRQAIIDAALSKEKDDGGWSTSSLASWKRLDSTALDTASDGYATGLITLALQGAGVPSNDVRVSKGLAWLTKHQDPNTGAWFAASLNRERNPRSDIGKFMSDAATAYAVLALTAESPTKK